MRIVAGLCVVAASLIGSAGEDGPEPDAKL
ncbi:MAG: hypothetical protein QG656_54, partial [Candidatus Hydrogenedentes bacterium]|nr:hypothetical protein [Candidatus Hydrogenedentota bacterium]